MAKQTINIGTTANDGTGDPIRAAFGKVNDNFTEIYTANTGVNTGDQNLSAYATTAAVAAGYQPLDSDLTAISALTTTAYGRALLSTADAATLRSAIGVGTTDAPTFLNVTAGTVTATTELVAPSINKAIKFGSKWLGTDASQIWVAKSNGVVTFALSGSGEGPTIAGDMALGWTSTNMASGTATLLLAQDAAGILAQRNASAAQALRVYNTLPAGSPTAGEWLEIDWQTAPLNTVKIGTNKGAAGTRRALHLCIEGNAIFGLSKDALSSGAWWSIATSGNLLCDVHNVYDIGQNAGNRPRTIYSATSLVSAFLDITGAARVTAKYEIYGSLNILSPSDGVMRIINGNQTAFDRVQLGSGTSAFPAIKRVGAELQVVIASTTAAINVSSVDADLTFIEDRYRRKGTNTPEGAVTAPIGAVYHRTDGGAGTSFYVKESTTGNTGWVAK